MINKKDVWNSAVEIMQAYTPYYQEKAVAAIEDANARNVWFMLLLARGAEPQPLTLEYVQTINPYAATPSSIERLTQGAADGFLKESDSGRYHITSKGLAALDAFFDTAHAGIKNAPGLETAEMNRLTEFFSAIVTATEALPEPKNKHTLSSSRWTDPGKDAPATVKLDQYITDLLRFRDDAHTASWQSYDVSGLVWETLTLVWNDDAHTAKELAEKLERRGYSEADYAKALEKLVKKNWLIEMDGQYQLTDEGRRVREEAEDETDRLFYLGWAGLSQIDLAEMNKLLGELHTLLKEKVEAEAVAT